MRGPLGAARPLSLAALDAAISETIGKPVRADRLARDDRVFRWIVRRAIAEGSLRFRTTYAEAAAGAGYDVPQLSCRANRRRAREQRVSTVYRALRSLEAAGLVRFRGLKRENGQWRCLSVGLTPAAYGPCAPFGRSRRAPRRLPGCRIRFLRRSGTSPPVVTTKSAPESGSVRARAREGPPAAARAGLAPAKFNSDSLAAALCSPPEPETSAEGPRPWPEDFWDTRDPRAAALVELFEAEFDMPAKFSHRRHGPTLVRVLDRLDRFGWADPTVSARPHGTGFGRAWALIHRWGGLYRVGNRRATRVRSLAYFLPKLDQESKRLRRRARALEREEW